MGNVRHISDLKVDRSGQLWITAATDPGDDGPFDSAVYEAGKFLIQGETIAFQENTELLPLSRFPGHKIEAIELIGETQRETILGTDDENSGSSVMRFAD